MSFGCLLTNDMTLNYLGHKLGFLGTEYRRDLELVQNLIGSLVVLCECS